MPRSRRSAALMVVALELLGSPAAAQVTRPVVFVAPQAPELDASLHDAVSAQFSGVAAALSFERFASDAPTLRAQVAQARALAAQSGAVGVFWLDVDAEKDWLIYLAEPSGDRVLVRRIPIEPDSVAATVEAVAVILRQSTEALLSGQTIGMQPVRIPEEPAPVAAKATPAPRAAPRRPAHPVLAETRSLAGPYLGLAYYGDSMGGPIVWQGGLRVSAWYRSTPGLYGGLGFVSFRDATFERSGVSLRLQRTPFDATLGMAFSRGRLAPAVELRGVVEWLGREALPVAPRLRAGPDSTRVLASLSPRLRLDYRLTTVLGAYLAGGADLALNPFSYVSRGATGETSLLEIRPVRLAVEAGITVRP